MMEKAPLLSRPILEERSMRAVELEFLKLFNELFEAYQKESEKGVRFKELEAMTPEKTTCRKKKRVVEWLKRDTAMDWKQRQFAT